MNRRISSPMFVKPNGTSTSLIRLARGHDRFNESFLQELLVRNPELLPVGSFREDVGVLLCIGREVKCAVGKIDNLYLSTGGYPVVVETKLWRNPQARREVLSQVLDYTKELVEKDFEWFENQWKTFCADRSVRVESLIDKLNEISDDEIDESYFVDRVNRALRRGDILSLIVGDGIETGLQKLVSHVCKDSAHLRYSLALVELACYEHEETKESKQLLVVPRIVQSVDPIQRAYVRIDYSPEIESSLKISSVVEEHDISKTSYKRTNLTEDEFLIGLDQSIGASKREQVKNFYDNLVDKLELEAEFGSATLMIKIPDPTNENPGASVLAIVREGKIYNPKYMLNQLIRMGVDREMSESISFNYWKELNKIDKQFDVKGMGHKKKKPHIPISDLIPKFDKISKAIEIAMNQVRHYFGETV